MDAVKLQSLNCLVGSYTERFGTREDFKILLEIGAHQQKQVPITLKGLLHGVNIPESTLKRRLSRLVRKRFVLKQAMPTDNRVSIYRLSDPTLKILQEMAEAIRTFDWA